MQDLDELADMKQRVAQAEAFFKEARQSGDLRSDRLVQLIRTIEAKFAHCQGEIGDLRKERAKILAENRRLRGNLQGLRRQVQKAAARERGLRLDELKVLTRALEKAAGPDSADSTDDKAPIGAKGATANGGSDSAAPAKPFAAVRIDAQDRRAGRKGTRRRRARARFSPLAKTLATAAALGWLAAAVLTVDKVHAVSIGNSLKQALVLSHSERHGLSQKLERISGELEAVKSDLSRYQDHELRAGN